MKGEIIMINLVKRWLEHDGQLTENAHEAIFVTQKGILFDGEFDCGLRGIDHASIECVPENYNRNDPYFWDKIHQDFKIVRLVPELSQAFALKRQRLTKEQKSTINNLGYKLLRY